MVTDLGNVLRAAHMKRPKFIKPETYFPTLRTRPRKMTPEQILKTLQSHFPREDAPHGSA